MLGVLPASGVAIWGLKQTHEHTHTHAHTQHTDTHTHTYWCRPRVDVLLEKLCAGLLPAELPAALQGLQYSAGHVRAASLEALPHVPCLAAGAAHHAQACLGFRV